MFALEGGRLPTAQEAAPRHGHHAKHRRRCVLNRRAQRPQSLRQADARDPRHRLHRCHSLTCSTARCHAQSGPRAPLHARGRDAVRAAGRGERVEARVRCGVVGLPGATEEGGDRREEGERVLWEHCARGVQAPRPVGLGREHTSKTDRVLVWQQRVRQHARRVPHSRKRRRMRHQSTDMHRLTRVASLEARCDTARLHRLPLGARVLCKRPTARGEYEKARATLRKPPTGEEAKSARATRNDVDAIAAYRCCRNAHDDLARVESTLQCAKRHLVLCNHIEALQR